MLSLTDGTIPMLAALVACAPVVAGAQEPDPRVVTGRVTMGRSDAPFGGALVRVRGDHSGICADEEGLFTLPVPEGSVEIEVRPVGYPARTFTLPEERSYVLMDLERDVVHLDALEVQVQRRGSADAVRLVPADDADFLEGSEIDRAPASTVEEAMSGRLAGVEITSNSGAPGGGMRAVTRGVATVLGGADPLYVVDGVIVSNAQISSGRHVVTAPSPNPGAGASQDDAPNRISDLNPSDIERIEVLRGASATAMYGSKGTNGVVLITTRRGAPTASVASGPAADSEIECFLAAEGGSDEGS
ncbi:MAG: TonB-dependent receptor plug domain-containing protein [Gemmatimonadota bacterium]